MGMSTPNDRRADQDRAQDPQTAFNDSGHAVRATHAKSHGLL
ncbi:MAG: hypothetical protein K0S79_259 [Nitrospira sp.]|nr:hypothetical protein [Nitrospira sp.]